MNITTVGFGCAAHDRAEPEIVCPARSGPHLWLSVGSHAHATAENDQIADIKCYSCHAYQTCRGTVGENRDRSES
jgi:hypothetical protein